MAKDTWAGAREILLTKAKAFAAGFTALITGELLALLLDPKFAEAVAHAVPAAVVPFVPFVFAFVVGLITHATKNKPADESGQRVSPDE